MLLKLENPKMLSDAISIISEIVTEVRIKVDSLGLSIVAIDPANVALVSFKLPASVFSNFEVTQETLGVTLDSLKSVLKRCGVGSSLVLQTEDNLLKIEIQDKIKRTFNLALIEIEREEKAVPSLEFSSRVEMDVSHFSEAIEDCAVVADACTFATKEENFIVEARGLNSARSEFSSDEAKISLGNVKSRYSLEYLQKFIKASRLVDSVVIQFADDYPLKLDFKNERLELSFILAPRVESED